MEEVIPLSERGNVSLKRDTRGICDFHPKSEIADFRGLSRGYFSGEIEKTGNRIRSSFFVGARHA